MGMGMEWMCMILWLILLWIEMIRSEEKGENGSKTI